MFSKWGAEGLSEGKHADYCIVKWLLISPACFNPRHTTVALSPSNSNWASEGTCITGEQGLIVNSIGY